MKPLFEIATFWRGEPFSLDYAEVIPDVDPSLEVRVRAVDPFEPLPRKKSDLGDLASACVVAIVMHVGLLGMGMWARSLDTEDEPPSLRTLGTLAGNIEPGGSEGSTPTGGTAADAIAVPVPNHAWTKPRETMFALDTEADFGMVGLLRDLEIGGPATSWGTGAGDIFGDGNAPSLDPGLSGTGEGGGGRFEGIDIGAIGTIGATCDDACVGTGMGYGAAVGNLRGHAVRPITCTFGQMLATSSGRLAPEVIQRIVRQNMGRFRACYEDGLRRDPSLAGRVEIKFVIDRSGEVTSAADSGSSLSDAEVVACIGRAYRSLSFPEQDGLVFVTYPLDLTRD